MASSSLMALPREIRQQIFEYILPLDDTMVDMSEWMSTLPPSRQKYMLNESPRRHKKRKSLMIRNMDPSYFYPTLTWPANRITYYVKDAYANEFGAGINRRITTYHCLDHDRIRDLVRLMYVNRSIYEHATLLLYEKLELDFDKDFHALIPFLSGLTPYALSCVRSIAIKKRASPSEDDIHQRDWDNAIHFLAHGAKGLRLTSLRVGVPSAPVLSRASRALPVPPNNAIPYTAEECAALSQRACLAWLDDLAAIRGLRKFSIYDTRSWPPLSSTSPEYEENKRFRASLATSLADFLKSKMLSDRSNG